MPAPRRKVRDRKDAHELLSSLSRSGLPLSAFCRKAGVDGRSLQCWRLNLGHDREEHDANRAPVVRLVEVGGEPAAEEACYRIVVGDVAIEFDERFSDDTVLRLMDLAREW